MAPRFRSMRVMLLTFAAALIALTGGSASALAVEPNGMGCPPDAEAAIQQVIVEVEFERGLVTTDPLVWRCLTRETLRSYLAERINAAGATESAATSDTLLHLLGLLGASEQAQDAQLDFLVDQVGGLYDPDARSLYVILDTPSTTISVSSPGAGSAGAGAAAGFGPWEQFIFAHELTHALQDQHFGLTALLSGQSGGGSAQENGDRALAVRALVEGDAQLSQLRWLRRRVQALGDDEGFAFGLAIAVHGLHVAVEYPPEPAPEPGSAAGTATPGGESGPRPLPRLVSGPKFLQDEARLLYTAGQAFAQAALERASDYSGVDAVYAQPPVSTAQVLHPDQYWTGVTPVEVDMPDLASRLGSGWRTLGDGTLGELETRVLLAQCNDENTAATAAAGWSGGRMQVLQQAQGGRSALAFKLLWETPQNAQDFDRAYTRCLQSLQAQGAATALVRSGQAVTVAIAPDAATAQSLANTAGNGGTT